MAEAPTTVLVVESSDDVRRLVAALLARAGYRVLEAGSVDAACALLDQQPGIDLLLADVIAPGELDCVDLAKRARARRPELKMLFSAGLARYLRELTGNGHQSPAEVLQDPERAAPFLAMIEAALTST